MTESIPNNRTASSANSADTPRERLHYLDYIRFLSFGSVILYHMMVHLPEFGLRKAKEVKWLYQFSNATLPTIAVCLFFILSGVGLTLSAGKKLDIKKFYWRRLPRLLVPAYLFYLFTFCLYFFRHDGHVFSRTIPRWRFIFTILGMDEYVQYCGLPTFTLGVGGWFLGVLMILYLVYPLLWHLMQGRRRHITMIVATLLYLLFVYGGLPLGNLVTLFLKAYAFLIGMYLAGVSKPPRWSIWVSIAVVAVFLLYPARLPFYLGKDPQNLLCAVAIYILFQAIEPFLKRLHPLNVLLEVFSNYSYELYLVHHMVILQVLGHLPTGADYTKTEILCISIVQLAITTLGAIILKELSNRVFGVMKLMTQPS